MFKGFIVIHESFTQVFLFQKDASQVAFVKSVELESAVKQNTKLA